MKRHETLILRLSAAIYSPEPPPGCTLALVVDLLGSDDFVEDRGEGLVLANDVGGHQGGHDQLPLPDVGFHGNPGQEDHKNQDQELGQTDTNHLQGEAWPRAGCFPNKCGIFF